MVKICENCDTQKTKTLLRHVTIPTSHHPQVGHEPTSQVGNCITPRPEARPSANKTWDLKDLDRKKWRPSWCFRWGDPYNELEDLTFQSFRKNV